MCQHNKAAEKNMYHRVLIAVTAAPLAQGAKNANKFPVKYKITESSMKGGGSKKGKWEEETLQ